MFSEKKKPRVSIGLPVYNGENYLCETIESILRQNYADFELIISDNASTDRTPEICQRYAVHDERISYYRNDRNIGAAKNFNRVFELSRGDYFKWAAHDDLIEPEYVQKCVQILDEDISVILCYSKVTIIDKNGKPIEQFENRLQRTASSKAADRFGAIILFDRWCFEVFGLIRAEALKKTSLIQSFIASDRALRAELSLLGRFFEISERLFLSRDHPQRSVRAMPVHHLRGKWFDPALKPSFVLPHCRIYYEYYKTLKRSSLAPKEKLACFGYILRWPLTLGNFRWMHADFLIAFTPSYWKFILKMLRLNYNFSKK
jgi:glycosyltransferase involved in cell wall biosynthesis